MSAKQREGTVAKYTLTTTFSKRQNILFVFTFWKNSNNDLFDYRNINDCGNEIKPERFASNKCLIDNLTKGLNF